MLARVGAKVSGRDSKVTTVLSNKMRAGFVNFQGRFFCKSGRFFLSQSQFSENQSHLFLKSVAVFGKPVSFFLKSVAVFGKFVFFLL